MTTKTYDRMITAMPSGLDRSALRVLSFHTGKKRAIGRGQLVAGIRLEGFEVNERQVRRCVHDLRREGHLICSAPGESGGYYLAASLDEFREFIDRELHPKAIDMLETESKMKESARQQFGEASQAQLI